MKIWCCACDDFVEARLTVGKEIYPHRRDLAMTPFWRCDTCDNYVGCHPPNRETKTRPLGVIATPELREARRHIHEILDPIWKSGRMSREEIYKHIAKELDMQEYHTAEITSIELARRVWIIVRDLAAA